MNKTLSTTQFLHSCVRVENIEKEKKKRTERKRKSVFVTHNENENKRVKQNNPFCLISNYA